METFFQDLRFGTRALGRTPGFAVAAVGVIALAIGANSAVFSVIEAVLLHPLPYRDSDRLAVLWKTVPSKHIEWDWSSGPMVEDWRRRNGVFEDMSMFLRPEASLATWTTSNGPEKLQACETGRGFFELLGVKPALGRVFSREESRRGEELAVLSHGFWKSRFGADQGILGKTLSLQGRSFTIIGVMPPEFQFPDQKTVLWLPLESDARWPLWQQQRFRIADAFGVVARLKPGFSMAQATADLNSIAQALAREHKETDSGLGVRVVPLAEQMVGAEPRRSLWLLEGAVACILLMACSNIASLLTVRGRNKGREIAIRAALGAGRGRILRLLAAENLLLFGAGGIAGLLVAAGGLRALLALAPPGVPRLEGASINFTVFAFAFGLSLISGVIFGVLPALQATAKQPETNLRDAGRAATAGPGGQRLRRSLVTTQFALAVILLGAAGLLVRSFRLLLEVNPGFDTAHLLTLLAELPAARYDSEERIRAFIDQAIEKINAVAGVREAAAGSASIGIFSGQTPDESIITVDRPFAPDFQRHQRDLVSDDYFRVMGIPLRQGRLFSGEDVHGRAAAAVINETMARRFWPGQHPLGKRFKEVLQGTGDTWMTVVGVVGDTSRNRDGSVEPTFYRSIRQWALPRMEMVIRTGSAPGPLVGAVREAVRSTDLSLPLFQVTPVEQRLRELDGPRRFQTVLLAMFAACALLLAAVGLHGLLSSSVEQRTREIGIRVALGATAASVMRLIVREGLLCALIGSAIGLMGTVAAGRAISMWLFGVTATDPATLLLAMAVLGVVILGVSMFAAVRSTRIDPVIALREE